MRGRKERVFGIVMLFLYILYMEQWRDIKNYEGLYQVSNLGRVKSCYRKNGETILKIQYNLDGHGRVELYKNGLGKRYYIHRLVAEAFIPNQQNLPIINHRDENPENNIVDNLEWCDFKYNSNYGNGIKKSALKRTNNTITRKETNQYSADGLFIKTYPSIKEAERQTGINSKNISKCCNNKPHFKTAGGFIWKYKKDCV